MSPFEIQIGKLWPSGVTSNLKAKLKTHKKSRALRYHVAYKLIS